MTAPEVIQQPGAVQGLLQGFQAGFTPILQAMQFRRQLDVNRAQLAIDKQRADTMEGFRTAEADAYRQKVADQQAQLDAATRANQIFTHLAQTGAFGDPIAHAQDPTKGQPDQQAITNALAGENGLVQQAFGQHMTEYATNLAGMAKAQSDQAAAESANRANRLNGAVQSVQAKYQGQDLTDPKRGGQFVSDLATVSIPAAESAAAALNKASDNVSFIISPATGQVFIGDKKARTVTPTTANVGVKGSMGTLTPQEAQIAATQLVDGIDRYLALARTDPSSIRPSGLASTLQGASGKSVAGIPLGGAAQVGAQMVRTPNQQVALQLQNQIMSNYLNLQLKSRQSQSIAQQTVGGYFPSAGTATPAIASGLQSLLGLRNLYAKLRDGKPFDQRADPNFSKFAQAAMQDQQQQPIGGADPGDYLKP